MGRRRSRRFWPLIVLLLASPRASAQPPAADADSGAGVTGRHVALTLMAQLSQARREGRVQRSRCLDDLLTQANSTRAQIERLHQALIDARTRGDAAAVERARTRLGHLQRRAVTLGREARSCRGERVADATHVTATIPLAPQSEPAPL